MESEKETSSESKVIIPAQIDDNIKSEIKRLAVKAFKAIDGKGFGIGLCYDLNVCIFPKSSC